MQTQPYTHISFETASRNIKIKVFLINYFQNNFTPLFTLHAPDIILYFSITI